MSEHTVGRPMEILLVEDGLTDARLVIEGLKKGGFRHRVTLVRDGEEALNFVCKHGRFARAPRPDIILLDLYLPKRNGMEVLAELKNDYDLKSIPVNTAPLRRATRRVPRCSPGCGLTDLVFISIRSLGVLRCPMR